MEQFVFNMLVYLHESTSVPRDRWILKPFGLVFLVVVSYLPGWWELNPGSL